MRITRLVLVSIATVLVGASAICAQVVTDELAASLATTFCPPAVVTENGRSGDMDLLDDPLSQMQAHRLDGLGFDLYMGYKEIHFPSDPKTYVMLFWLDRSHVTYWRLLASSDAKTFQLIQDSNAFFVFPALYPVWVALADLDGDGIPEVLLQGGGGGSVTGMYIFAWRGGQLVLISPTDDYPVYNKFARPPLVFTQIYSDDNDVVLQDLDGDGKAEIIAYPNLMNQPVGTNPNGTPEISPVAQGPNRIFKLDSTGVYKLWKTVPADDPVPVTVPSIAVVHPGTIPLSELSNTKGGGDLRVFVSHPAGTSYAVDDFVTTSFSFDVTKTPVAFKKRWDNQAYPDLSRGNREWLGVPVCQAARPSQGEWNVNPSDPTYPSPDPTMEFHFLGPYLELRLDKSVVYPFLLQRATADFAKDPAKTTTFVEVPISGKMKDGKLAAVGAIVCVKKTGAAK